MANTRAGNVIRVDTSANFTDIREVHALKFIGHSSVVAGEVTLTAAVPAGDNSGHLLWDNGNTTTTDLLEHGLCIVCGDGIYVNVAHGAVVYLYTGDE